MTIRQLPSGSWNTQVRIYGKYKSITAKTKKECEEKANKIIKYCRNGELTVGMALDKYIDLIEPVSSPLTIEGYRRCRKYAFQSLMDVDISALTDDIIQRAINDEMYRTTPNGKRISAKTIKNNMSVIATSLARQGLRFNYKLPKTHRVNKILPEPVDVIKAVKDTEIELPCLLSIWMSLRQAEIVALTKDSIHGDFLTIDKTRNRINGKDTIKSYAKTDLSIRTLKMPPYIKHLITNTDAYLNGEPDSLIFPYTGNSLHHRFRVAMQKAGIKVRFHDLRHIFASVSLSILNIPSRQVQKEGGWSTPTTLENIYSNTFNSLDQESYQKRNEYYDKLMHN